MKKPTEGPWMMVPEDDHWWKIVSWNGKKEFGVHLSATSDDFEQNYSNVHLMAEAPELLRRLRDVLEALEHPGPIGQWKAKWIEEHWAYLKKLGYQNVSESDTKED